MEVERATRPFRFGDQTYPENSFVIRGSQPFRPYLTDLLNPQVYPDMRLYPGGPPDRPYDITGWTLPMQMGVAVDRHTDVKRLPSDTLVRVDRAEAGRSVIAEDAGFGFALDPRANDSFTAVNRLLASGATVYRARGDVAVSGGITRPAGTFIVPASDETRSRLEQSTAALGLSVEALESSPGSQLARLAPPRVALYRGWGSNADEGWTRFVLEAFEFPYVSLRDADLRENRLAQYDVIVLPDASYQRMLTGLATEAAPPEFTGGMTPRGVSHLYEFVERGGTLVTLDSASELPIIDFGLPIRDVTAGHADADFYVPGTLLALEVDPTHPVGYGMPPQTAAFFARSPAFGVPDTSAGDDVISVVARYPQTDLLRSGWLLGEDVLADRAAVVEAKVGRGRVVLVGFRAQHRGQPHGTFKLLFNALYLASTEGHDREAQR